MLSILEVRDTVITTKETSNLTQRISFIKSSLDSPGVSSISQPEQLSIPFTSSPDKLKQKQSTQSHTQPQQIFGPYKLIKTIGVGEFGKVKLAVHLDTLKRVAIKLIKKESILDEAKKSKLNREIRILQSVSHAYIVKLLQVIETDNYIVNE